MPTPEMKTRTAEGKRLSDCFPGGVLGGQNRKNEDNIILEQYIFNSN